MRPRRPKRRSTRSSPSRFRRAIRPPGRSGSTRTPLTSPEPKRRKRHDPRPADDPDRDQAWLETSPPRGAVRPGGGDAGARGGPGLRNRFRAPRLPRRAGGDAAPRALVGTVALLSPEQSPGRRVPPQLRDRSRRAAPGLELRDPRRDRLGRGQLVAALRRRRAGGSQRPQPGPYLHPGIRAVGVRAARSRLAALGVAPGNAVASGLRRELLGGAGDGLEREHEPDGWPRMGIAEWGAPGPGAPRLSAGSAALQPVLLPEDRELRRPAATRVLVA